MLSPVQCLQDTAELIPLLEEVEGKKHVRWSFAQPSPMEQRLGAHTTGEHNGMARHSTARGCHCAPGTAPRQRSSAHGLPIPRVLPAGGAPPSQCPIQPRTEHCGCSLTPPVLGSHETLIFIAGWRVRAAAATSTHPAGSRTLSAVFASQAKRMLLPPPASLLHPLHLPAAQPPPACSSCSRDTGHRWWEATGLGLPGWPGWCCEGPVQ